MSRSAVPLAALLAGLALAVLLSRPVQGRQRLAALAPGARRPRAALTRQAACVLAGVGVAVLGGLPAGVLAGAVVILAGPGLLGRLEPAATRREREQRLADLPLMFDLLSACLAGGAGLGPAARAVAAAVPGPAGSRLQAVAEALAAGTAPGQAWLYLSTGPDDPLAPAARLLARAADSGTPVAATMARLSAETRAVARAAAAARARRVGVLVVAPLGLCFLPAFVLLGVVPVIAGLAGPLFAAL